ncbi:hypothetical protein Cch01nite_12960 [Cellulomonas chitinilytica]|uniref:Uncharacterized protein n=1 Tax=Cellulomonas chitinilytica TaxID=398759 RepID=A0A919U1J7_9CELL|nr:hypothetical protein Cch01nite_12960 [Cellulomonas chitinilytica]
MPTGTFTDALAVPFDRRFSGCAPGVQSLNVPTTLTFPSTADDGRAKVSVQVAAERDFFSTGGSTSLGRADAYPRIVARPCFVECLGRMTGM